MKPDENNHRIHRPMSRREMLGLCKSGFGSVALMGLMSSIPFGCQIRQEEKIIEEASKGFIQLPHRTPEAKNVIFLFMDGGVSQVDSFDPKPPLKNLKLKIPSLTTLVKSSKVPGNLSSMERVGFP